MQPPGFANATIRTTSPVPAARHFPALPDGEQLHDYCLVESISGAGDGGSGETAHGGNN